MTRFARVLATAVLLTITVDAASARPRVSITGGYSLAKHQSLSSPVADFEAIGSLAGGVGVAWPLPGGLEIQPEVRYAVKGFSFGESEATDDQGNPLGTYESLWATDYLEVPVLVRWTIPTGGRFHPVLAAGPFVAFELRERMRNLGALETSADTDVFEDTDFGAAFGAGLQGDLGPGSWLLEGRYAMGLTKLGDVGTDEPRSGAFQILAGFRF